MHETMYVHMLDCPHIGCPHMTSVLCTAFRRLL